uniref:Uncharacterized protein n=1 Tax=Meloidogyne javanica TaxID=6303 RepID=A0A915MIX7_MELJA
MRVFSHILMQTCCADLIMLSINLLAQPIYASDEGVGIVILNGPMRHLGTLPQNLILFIWDNCFFFSFFGFAAQFIYPSILYVAGLPQVGKDKCCSNPVILQLLEWDNGDKIQLAQSASLLPLLAIIPVWTTLISSLFNANFSTVDSGPLQVMMLVRLPIHWIAVLNPVVTILTVKHYKSAIQSLILHGTAKVHSTTSQHTQQVLGNTQNGNVIIYHTPQNKMVPKSPLPGDEQHHKEHQKVQLDKDKQNSKIQYKVIAKKESKKHKLEHSTPSSEHSNPSTNVGDVGEKNNEFEYYHHVVDIDNYDQAYFYAKNEYENHFLDQVNAKLDKDIDDNEVNDKLLSVKQKELEDALIGDEQIKDSDVN